MTNKKIAEHNVGGGVMTKEEIIKRLEAVKTECGKCLNEGFAWIGHWIFRNSFLLQYECSECGWRSEKYNYCPNCRCRMVEL